MRILNMKCNCGFQATRSTDKEGDLLPHRIDEDFIKTDLRVTVNMREQWQDYDNFKSSAVYICPRCGQLQIDIETTY